MFRLFIKECMKIGKSLIYLAFICVIIILYVTQYVPDSQQPVSAPVYVENIEKYYEKNNSYPYGYNYEETPEQVIPKATLKLYEEFIEGTYESRPVGFAKKVRVSNEDKKRIGEILKIITAKSLAELDNLYKNNQWSKINFTNSKDYNAFKKLMREVDSIIGGNSSYSKESLKNFGIRPINYEEAMVTYKNLIEKDKITNAFSRLFCDYMGIVMGLFPIFVVVSYTLKDRKSNMKDLIYIRGISSTKLILSRYFALTINERFYIQ